MTTSLNLSASSACSAVLILIIRGLTFGESFEEPLVRAIGIRSVIFKGVDLVLGSVAQKRGYNRHGGGRGVDADDPKVLHVNLDDLLTELYIFLRAGQ